MLINQSKQIIDLKIPRSAKKCQEIPSNAKKYQVGFGNWNWHVFRNCGRVCFQSCWADFVEMSDVYFLSGSMVVKYRRAIMQRTVRREGQNRRLFKFVWHLLKMLLGPRNPLPLETIAKAMRSSDQCPLISRLLQLMAIN